MVRGLTIGLVGSLLVGCGLTLDLDPPDRPGVDAGGPDASASDAGRLDASADDAGMDDAGMPDAGLDPRICGEAAGAACDPASCPGLRCEAGACSFFSNCRDLHRCRPEAPSAPYPLTSPLSPASRAYDAYCEMDVAGGGWTLVGRSAPIPDADSKPFGWAESYGGITDDSIPYSLGPASLGLDFTLVLVAVYDRGSPGRVGDRAYIVRVPGDFATRCGLIGCATTVTSVLAGPCPIAADQPHMLSSFGHTSALGHFFFRDSAVDDGFTGLYPNGFALNGYRNCEYSGELDQLTGAPEEVPDRQGMLLVR